MSELKPCPFCEWKSVKVEMKSGKTGYTGLDHLVRHRTYSVRCNRCRARGPAFGGKVIIGFDLTMKLPKWATTDAELKEKAIEAWNRRVYDERI